MCQGNQFVISICEQDLEATKKKELETGKDNKTNNQKIATDSSEISENRFKSFNKKIPTSSVINKHIKENKMNSSGLNPQNMDKRKKVLSEICDIAPILCLRVLIKIIYI